jgi:hypothetical protein
MGFLLLWPQDIKGLLTLRAIPGKTKELYNMLHRAKTFFKHAKRDPTDILEFNPEANESTLFECSLKYIQLTAAEESALNQ